MIPLTVIPSSGVNCIKILRPRSTLRQTPGTQGYPSSDPPYLILRLPQCCFLSFLDLTKYLHYFKWINKFFFQILLLLSELLFELTHKKNRCRRQKVGRRFSERERQHLPVLILLFSFYFFFIFHFFFFFFSRFKFLTFFCGGDWTGFGYCNLSIHHAENEEYL
jgi:hypothetical protein